MSMHGLTKPVMVASWPSFFSSQPVHTVEKPERKDSGFHFCSTNEYILLTGKLAIAITRHQAN
eukprot:scaffold4637_cov128-Cylindrotheca_fusiformis.AAC.21